MHAIHPAVDRQRLATFPRIAHDGGVGRVHDLLGDVELDQAVGGGAAAHVAQVFAVLVAHVAHVTKPVVGQADARIGQRRMHA